jgi:PiT family inorganic phosphate transporter
VAKVGWSAITWGTKWIQTLSFIVISPLVGGLAGFILMVAVYWTFKNMGPARVDRFFRTMQLASSALLSHAHGANDAQKTMGIIVGLLVSVKPLTATETGFFHHFYVSGDGIPLWVKMGAYTAISLGTLSGGWRIVHTMGSRITRLRPVSGFAAETGGAIAITVATHYGIPVSTTHTIAGSIIGAGATYRFSAVRWGIARRIVWAWVITIPASATVAALSYWALAAFGLR